MFDCDQNGDCSLIHYYLILVFCLQIAPFDIEFSVTHKELDFSHLLVLIPTAAGCFITYRNRWYKLICIGDCFVFSVLSICDSLNMDKACVFLHIDHL